MVPHNQCSPKYVLGTHTLNINCAGVSNEVKQRMWKVGSCDNVIAPMRRLLPVTSKKLGMPNLPVSSHDKETNSGDEFLCGEEEAAALGPPLQPFIAWAIMLSPYWQVSLSAIYTYCIRHCLYYKERQYLCHRTVNRVLAREACFKRLPQENGRPDCWTFDMQYKDKLRELSNNITDLASRKPSDRDHKGYAKRSLSDPDGAGDTSGRLTEADAQLGLDSDGTTNPPLRQRLHGLGGVRSRDESDTESGLRSSPKRPHLQSVTRSPQMDYPYPDRPIDVYDMLDIKDEPFPEELPVGGICNEEKGELRQKQDCENTTEGEEQCPLWLPEKADVIVEQETVEFVDLTVPSSKLTVKQKKLPVKANFTKQDTAELFDPSLSLSELMVKQGKHCESTTEGEEQPPLRLFEKADVIVEQETVELVDLTVPSSELTGKQKKLHVETDVTKQVMVELFDPTLPLSELVVKQGKEDHSTTHASHTLGTFHSRNIPVYESLVDFGIVKEKPLARSSPRNGHVGDTRLERTQRRAGPVAVSPVKNGHSPDGCNEHSGHPGKRIPYSQIITMAIINSPKRRLSLREIYRYAMRKFPGVKFWGNWQNSIRVLLSISPLFVKMQCTNNGEKDHYWTLEPSFLDTLEEHFTEGNQCSCQWQLVCRLVRLPPRLAPRLPPQLPPRLPMRWKLPQKPLPESPKRHGRTKSVGDGGQGDTPPANNSKKLGIRKAHDSAHGSESDLGDEFDCDEEEAAVPGPRLQPLIARAIMLSPHRQLPLSAIYAYCSRHCLYYRDNRILCQRAVKRILAREACFERLLQEKDRPDYWKLDMRYKDKLDELLSDVTDPTSSNPWGQDCSLSDPDKGGDTGGRLTEANTQRGADTDGAANPPLWQRLLGPGGVRSRDESGTESELRCSAKRPHLQSVASSQQMDYPYPDRPNDVCDELDIKEEPFPEELPVGDICNEEKGEQRQKLDWSCENNAPEEIDLLCHEVLYSSSENDAPEETDLLCHEVQLPQTIL